MELIKENFSAIKSTVNEEREYIFEWDINVPDIKPDIEKTLSVDAIPKITSLKETDERIMLDGTVKLNIIYISSEIENIKSIDCVKDFTYIMELPGYLEGMNVNISPEIKNTYVEIINGRKLRIKCLLNFIANIEKECDFLYLKDMEDSNICLKKQCISSLKQLSDNEFMINLKEEYELPVGKPSVQEILRTDIILKNKDIKPISNKLIVKGELDITIIYQSEAEKNNIEHMEYILPFTEIFDILNLKENSICDTDIIIENPVCFIKGDRDNEKRIVDFRTSLCIKNKSYEKVNEEVIIDAYSIKNEINLEKDKIIMDEIIDLKKEQISLKDTVCFDDVLNISKIISLKLNPIIETISYDNNNITGKGKIECCILFCDNNDKISFSKKDIPLTVNLGKNKVDTDITCDIKIELLNFSYNILSDNELDLRAMLLYNLRTKKKFDNEIVTDIEVKEEQNKSNAKITVYFCDENEELWNIAKKYKISPEKIKELNNIKGNNLCKGEKIIIA